MLERLLLEPARRAPELRFVVAGPQYPASIAWPANVERFEHVGPADHAEFYGVSRYTLNVTRADMVRAGWSPSVRLFEAAATGTPILSDFWDGLDTLFGPGRDILVVESADQVIDVLRNRSDDERIRMGAAGRARVMAAHTAAHRAEELESFLAEARRRRSPRSVLRSDHGAGHRQPQKTPTFGDLVEPPDETVRIAGLKQAGALVLHVLRCARISSEA